LKPGYGLTETSPTSHFNPVEYYESKAGSIGVPLPNLECRLVKDDGDDARDGEPGELWIRGPSIMKVLSLIFSYYLSRDLFSKGYFNNPKATLECITPDGWFQTGDVAVRSIDGWYSVVDRKKELIKYKGFQG
jgi:4-coumarate--CoA ligase